MASNLVTVDPGKKVFTTKSGKTYYIRLKGISVERYAKYIEYQTKYEFGYNGKELFLSDKTMYELLHKGDGESVKVMLHDRMISYASVEQRQIAAMDLCSLVINEEAEEDARFDALVMEEKKKDWMESGMDLFFFWNAANNLTERLPNHSISVIQDILQLVKKVSQPLPSEQNPS